MAAHRRSLLSAARGDVLELGAGTGANLLHYPDAVSAITATEPDAAMRRRLARKPAGGRPVAVVDAAAERLPFEDASFDTVVTTLVLCSVDDPAAALSEARRVLRTDGRLLFIEHVAAPGRAGLWQRRLQPVYGRLAAGCHLHRDSERAIIDAGFRIESIDRFIPPGRSGQMFPHIQGVAVPVRSP
jgi:ubiquinone/menaquinone biosynthesis C-methylase UbiE